MAIKLIGDTSGNTAEVDSVKNLLVTTPQTVNSTNSAKIGYTFLAAGPQNRALTTFGPMGRLATGLQTLELFDPVDGVVVNTNIWNTPAPTTMTVVQNATGFLVLNAGASIAINTFCQINSIKRIQLINTFVPTVRILFKTPNVPQTNATMELGFGASPNTTGAITDGALIRWNSAGEFRAITVFNSVEQQSGILSNPAVNVVHTLHIVFRGTKVEFWINELLVAEVSNAAGNSSPTATSRVPLFARVFNGATSPVTAPELHLAAVSLWRNDLNTNKLWPTQMSSIGRHCTSSPVTTFLQTANHANSTSPVSATLSNTAAGYTALGGRYQFAAPGGLATDYALFAFQVPTDYQLVITGIRIDAVNTGAAVATTATILDWGLAYNSSAVSLVTADTAGVAWSPRRVPLGIQSFIVGAAIGGAVETIDIQFDTPITVDSGRFFHVILQVPVGTATAAQVIRGNVMINGYFE